MTTDLGDFLPVVFLFVIAGGFAAASLGVSLLLAPRKPTPEKLAPYECGIVPEREPAERFPVRFYLVAMLFILFDIEIIFLYPFAVAFDALGWFGLAEVGIFTAILLFVYVYVWRAGVLDWNEALRARYARRSTVHISEKAA